VFAGAAPLVSSSRARGRENAAGFGHGPRLAVQKDLHVPARERQVSALFPNSQLK